jgi:uncharacterized membrane protein YhhN
MSYDKAAIILGMICLANAVIYIGAEWREWRTIRWVSKMAASTAFVMLAVSNGAVDSTYGRFILLALIFSWVGDALLLSLRNGFLLSGIAAFFLAHAAFAGGFATQPLNTTWLVIALAILTVAASALLSWLWKYLNPFYKIAVPVYLAAITIMTSIAISVSAAAFTPLLGVGAMVFTVSDVSVALNRFVERKISNKVWGLPLYYMAQLMFAMSVLSFR